jgi:hypothetical protein
VVTTEPIYSVTTKSFKSNVCAERCFHVKLHSIFKGFTGVVLLLDLHTGVGEREIFLLPHLLNVCTFSRLGMFCWCPNVPCQNFGNLWYFGPSLVGSQKFGCL